MLYIMRHGKTDWNELRKLQGRTDIELNEEGREMARKASKEYKDVHFDVCFCSPLKRAKETAELLLEGRDVPIVIDDRLIEMSFGVCEGIASSFDIPDCPINTLFLDTENYTEAVEGGETLEEVAERTGAFLSEKVEPLLKEGKDVLILGHGAANSVIMCQVRGRKITELFKQGVIHNCELITLK